MKRIKFKSLSSGSCGNCYFLGIFEDEEEGLGGQRCEAAVLVDAGVSPRRLKKELLREGINLDCLGGMLITHDHLDHIRSLGSYCKHLKLPVWLTPEISKVLSRHFMTAKYLGGVRRELSEGWNEIVPGRISARYFLVPHDASQTVGYAIHRRGRATGLSGRHRGDRVELRLRDAAQRPLHQGSAGQDMRRPRASLQRGVRRRRGGFRPRGAAQRTPQLAFDCTRKVLDPAVRLVPLPRQTPSPLFEL